MLVINPKVYVATGVGLALIAFAVLGVNQYLLQQQLNQQLKFDTTVMKQDGKLWSQLQKSLTPTATPTASLKVVKETPVPTGKVK